MEVGGVNRGSKPNTARNMDKEPRPPEASIRHVFGTTFSHVIRSRRSTRKLLADQRPELTGSAILAPDGDFFPKAGVLVSDQLP